jgi:hypothetical protein
MFVGTSVHSLDYTTMGWNMADPVVWLNMECPKYGLVAEIDREVYEWDLSTTYRGLCLRSATWMAAFHSTKLCIPRQPISNRSSQTIYGMYNIRI